MKQLKSILALTCSIVLFFGTASAQKDTTIQIKTSSQCEECKAKIEHALTFEKGVKKVNLDVKTKIVTVSYNPGKTTAEKVRKAITKVGYDADDMPADVKAYNKLSKCCQKGGHGE